MVRAAGFDRGDIIMVSLAPTIGREIRGENPRPGLVLSKTKFNALGVCLVAPITIGGDYSREAGFAVSLIGSGTKTQGVILSNMIRSLDLVGRGAKKIEAAPDYIVEDVLARIAAILE